MIHRVVAGAKVDVVELRLVSRDDDGDEVCLVVYVASGLDTLGASNQ
jgi:hypothetical protein